MPFGKTFHLLPKLKLPSLLSPPNYRSSHIGLIIGCCARANPKRASLERPPTSQNRKALRRNSPTLPQFSAFQNGKRHAMFEGVPDFNYCFRLLQQGRPVADRQKKAGDMSTYSNPLTDYSPQMEFYGGRGRHFPRKRGVLSDSDEMELASEFLEVANEEELEQFLDDLIGGIGSTLGKVVNSPIGKAVGGVLKDVAKTALPIAGGALGTFVGGPIGGMIGSNLASVAGSVLGLELEGLSPEDSEFEATKQFIRFAGQTVANALEAESQAGPYADPEAVAHAAAMEAARVYAPGLMDMAGAGHQPHHHLRSHEGCWVRHGHRIVLLGV